MSAVLLAVLAWALYSRYVSLFWVVVSATLLLISSGFLASLNTALIGLVVLRGIFDRYRREIFTLFVGLLIVKIVFITELYLDERLPLVYYLLDGVFTTTSAFMLSAYGFKPPRLKYAQVLAFPASALSSLLTLPASIVLGVLVALLDTPPYVAAALAAANAAYLYAVGDTAFFLPPLLFTVAYVIAYKRVLFLAEKPPAGWLYSWLGGRYKVVKLLGVGGFSYVLAVKRGGEIYAAKILRYTDDYGVPLAGDEKVLTFFGQEMNRYLEIKSERIVKAYEVYLPAVGYKDLRHYMRDPPYILLEYMRGTLRDVFRIRKTLPVPQVVEMFKQLAAGLYDIHRHNVVHLDIKPENIMFGEGGVVKIGDMGIAKVVAGGYVHSSYMSPAYAAPELKRGVASFASDVYSLACVIYEALTGINPNVFVENGYPAPPPSSYNKEVPPWLDELLLKMLAPDPARRPSAAEVLKALEGR